MAHLTSLPRSYAWPLPRAWSRVICHTNNTAHGIASTEVATVSPTAFLEPLRAGHPAGRQHGVDWMDGFRPRRSSFQTTRATRAAL